MVVKSLQFYSPGYPTTLYYGLLNIFRGIKARQVEGSKGKKFSRDQVEGS